MELKIMMKLVLGVSGAAGSVLMLGTGGPVSDPSHSYVQYGAMGILALCAIWLVTKIIPDAMKQRQVEIKEMLSTLITEREKLVSSMENLVNTHSSELREARHEAEKLVRDLTLNSEQERKEWATLTRESIEVQARTQVALTEITSVLRGCQLKNPNINAH